MIHQIPSDLSTPVRHAVGHQQYLRSFDGMRSQDHNLALDRLLLLGIDCAPVFVKDLAHSSVLAFGQPRHDRCCSHLDASNLRIVEHPPQMRGRVVLGLDRTQWNAVRMPFASWPTIIMFGVPGLRRRYNANLLSS